MNRLPTFILPGWTKDPSKWRPLIKLLEDDGLNIRLLPLPGLSSPLSKPWRLDDYEQWLNQKLVKNDNFNLIAHSFGGRIAIRFDRKNPNRIKKLVLIDSAGIRPSSFGAKVKRVSFKAVAKIGKKITTNPSARELLYKLAGEADYYQADKFLAQTMANVIEEDQRSELSFVKAHTLIIWGDNDKTTPLSDGRIINKTITGSTLKIVDSAGHSPQYTHPEPVAKFITQFLKH